MLPALSLFSEEIKKVIIHGGAYKFFMKDLNNTAYAFEPELVKQ